MKVQVQGKSWPQHMRGRELTVYIYRYHQGFEDVLPPDLLSVNDEHTWEYWEAFRTEAEQQMAEAGLEVQGIAEGDLGLGTYSSLRNESFCVAKPEWNLPQSWHGIDLGAAQGSEQWVYPPNIAGWNAAKHESPVSHKQSWTLMIMLTLGVIVVAGSAVALMLSLPE